MDAVVAEAAKLGYPVNEMAIGGGSAGGCLALLYAYRDTAESPVPVRFVFEAVGPSSFYPEDWDNYGLDKPEAQAEAAGLFGVMTGAKLTPDMFGTPAYDAAVKDASALLWVTKDAVPTVMAYCTHDTMQPFKASVRLDRALTENGVPPRLLCGGALGSRAPERQRSLSAISRNGAGVPKDLHAPGILAGFESVKEACI